MERLDLDVELRGVESRMRSCEVGRDGTGRRVWEVHGQKGLGPFVR